LFRGSVACGISFGISDIRRKRFARHSNRRLGGSTEIISGHRDPRDLLPNGPLDCTYHRNFVGRHEGEGVARSRRSAGPADAVNVVFRLLGNVVVDDVTDAGDIESALGDVRRDEHANLPCLEVVERTGALALRLVSVHRCGGDALIFQVLNDTIGAVLGAGENQNRIHLRFLE
jgi:hypothetical protein